MVGIFLGSVLKAKALQMLEVVGPAVGEWLPASPKSCGHVLESGVRARGPVPTEGSFFCVGDSGPDVTAALRRSRGPRKSLVST